MDWSLVLNVLVPLSAVVAIAIFLVEFTGFNTKKNVQSDVQISAPDPHSTCSLCNRSKAEVDNLVAGEAGSLCSNCLIDSALLLDDASMSNNKEGRFINRLVIASLSEPYESANSDENLKKYILDVGAENPEQRLNILIIAYSHANTALVIDCLNQVPQDSWTMKDLIFWMYANINDGKYKDALNHPEVKRENCSDTEFRTCTLNSIVAKLEMEPASEEIVQWLTELESMRSFYDKSGYPYPQDERNLLPNVISTTARCHYLLGNYDDALACLNEEIVSYRPSNSRELLRGRIHEKLGQMDAAKSSWQRGVQYNQKNISHKQLIQKLELLDE